MSRPLHEKLSRRERQIMDAIYALRYASASAVVEHIGEPEAHDSVRITLNTLEKKGYLKHHQEGNRNIYYPVVPHGEAQRSAMHHLTRTFFGNSPSRALLAFLDLQGDRLSEQELAELSRWIAEHSEQAE
jgi:predicted transcriptional regulator